MYSVALSNLVLLREREMWHMNICTVYCRNCHEPLPDTLYLYHIQIGLLQYRAFERITIYYYCLLIIIRYGRGGGWGAGIRGGEFNRSPSPLAPVLLTINMAGPYKWFAYLLRYNIYELVHEKANKSNWEADKPHHDPSVPVQPRRLLSEPILQAKHSVCKWMGQVIERATV